MKMVTWKVLTSATNLGQTVLFVMLLGGLYIKKCMVILSLEFSNRKTFISR